MGNIVLTSCGIIDYDFKRRFYNICSKEELNNKRVLYVTTASDGEEGDKSWMDIEYKTIIDLGINESNLFEYKIGNDVNIEEYDIIYMMGGNTFYLLDMIRKYRFDEVINQFLQNGDIYIGSSAGAIIIGKTIEPVLFMDENKVGLSDFKGLGLVDGIVIPHCNQYVEQVEIIKSSLKEKLYLLYDGDGIVINE